MLASLLGTLPIWFLFSNFLIGPCCLSMLCCFCFAFSWFSFQPPIDFMLNYTAFVIHTLQDHSFCCLYTACGLCPTESCFCCFIFIWRVIGKILLLLSFHCYGLYMAQSFFYLFWIAGAAKPEEGLPSPTHFLPANFMWIKSEVFKFEIMQSLD